MNKNNFKIFGNHVEIYDYKSGHTAYMDTEDFYKFNNSKIYFSSSPTRHDNYFVLKTYRDGRKQNISRIILNETRKNMVVDHINGNPLDDRKSNLRSISRADNMKNKATYKNNSSSHISGVTYIKRKKLWVARIQVDGNRIFLGSSKDFNKIKNIRLDAEKKYFGDLKQH